MYPRVPNVLFEALYELPNILLLRGGLPAGVVDLLVSHEGGLPAGVVEGAWEREDLPLRLGVLGEARKLKDILASSLGANVAWTPLVEVVK